MKHLILQSATRLLCLTLLLTIGGGLGLKAQSIDLENITKAKPVRVSGGIGANTVFTAGLPGNQPLSYFLNGNLNFNLFGTFKIPLTFNYCELRLSLSQGYSFNQLSISPTYKWATAHIGTNYMTFSPYTLNGHQFVGGGLELSPDKWKIQLMGGRLLRGQFADTTTTGPTFRRMGYGTKIEYNPGSFIAGITLFKAMDDAGSVPELRRFFNNQVINPEDNMVVGLHFGTTLFHALQFNVEYSNSVITRDQRPEYEQVRIRSLAGLLHRGNATTNSYHAFKTSLNYNIASTGTMVGVGFESVDPNYRTLGGYYFVNDLRNYTLNFNQVFSKGKITLGGNLGVQEDDIKKTKVNTQRRFVGALNAGINLNENTRMGLSFSNFQSYRFLNDTYSQITRIPGLVIDTLAFAMVSRTIGYDFAKTLTKTDLKQTSLLFNMSVIGSQNRREQVLDVESKTNIINSSLTYSIAYLEKQASLNTSLTFFRNVFFDGVVTGLGPTIGVQKTFIKTLNTSLNLSALNVYNTMIETDSPNSLALNAQLSANLRAGKNHNFNFNTGVVANNGNTFLNGNLGYNYSF